MGDSPPITPAKEQAIREDERKEILFSYIVALICVIVAVIGIIYVIGWIEIISSSLSLEAKFAGSIPLIWSTLKVLGVLNTSWGGKA
jgi:uncharacterized membrane protein